MKFKSIRVIGCIVLVLTTSVGWWEAKCARIARNSVLKSFRRQVEDQSKLAELEKRLAASQLERTSLRSLLEKTHQTHEEPPSAGKPGDGSAVPAFYEMLQNDPEFQTKWVAAKRGGIKTTYGAFFRMAKLASGEISAFEENALKWEEQQMDFDALVQSHGGRAHISSELGKLAWNQRAEYESNQRALLGETAYAQWQDYERTTRVRDIVSGFAGAAVLAGEPYTANQVDDVVAVIARASSDYKEGKAAELKQVDWTKVDEQVRGILSPEQYDAFVSTEPTGPTNAFGRRHAQFWNLVGKAQKAEAANAGAGQTVSK